MARVLLGPKRLESTEECGQGNGPSFNSSVRIPLSNLNGFEPDRLEMALTDQSSGGSVSPWAQTVGIDRGMRTREWSEF